MNPEDVQGYGEKPQIPYASKHTPLISEAAKARRSARLTFIALIALMVAGAGGIFYSFVELADRDSHIRRLVEDLDSERSWRVAHTHEVTALYAELTMTRAQKEEAELQVRKLRETLAQIEEMGTARMASRKAR